MYVSEKTIIASKVVCDYCGAIGSPYPEADGSPGLVKGWCCYEPEYLRTVLAPRRRVDFCQEKHRDLWMERQINLLRQQMWGRRIVYHFSNETYIYDVTVAERPVSLDEQLLHDVFQKIKESVPDGMKMVKYELDFAPLVADSAGRVDLSQVPQEINFKVWCLPIGENEK